MLKKIFITICFLLCIPSFASIPIDVIKIYDGDTIRAKIDTGNKFSIRLIGIDCYETSKIHRAYKQAYLDKLDIDDVIKKGKQATNYLKHLYNDASNITFDFRGVDKYSRVLGVVYFDNVNVNQKLIDENICAPFIYKE